MNPSGLILPPVILGLVPRTHFKAARDLTKTSIGGYARFIGSSGGAMGPRDKPEDDGSGGGVG